MLVAIGVECMSRTQALKSAQPKLERPPPTLQMSSWVLPKDLPFEAGQYLLPETPSNQLSGGHGGSFTWTRGSSSLTLDRGIMLLQKSGARVPPSRLKPSNAKPDGFQSMLLSYIRPAGSPFPCSMPHPVAQRLLSGQLRCLFAYPFPGLQFWTSGLDCTFHALPRLQT